DTSAATDQTTITNLATGSTYDLSKGIKDATRKGYAFTGWFTSETGTDKMPNSLVVPNGNTTYYAQWKANDYEVAFDKNATEATGTMSNQAFVYDKEQGLTANAYARPGYTFSGWNTKADGTGTTYNNKQSVKNLTTKSGDTVTLYAQWKANGYKVAFDKNATEAIGTMSNQTFVYDKEQGLTANDYTRPGYTFSGWNTKADGTGTTYNNKQSVKNLTTKSGDTVTLYAQWKANGYEVAFDKNATEATGTMSNQALIYDKEQGLTKNAYARSGYTFKGWSETPQESGNSLYGNMQKVKNLTTKSGDIVTLYAIWNANQNNIYFDANGGKTNQKTISQPTDTVVGLKDIEGATRKGYSFDGWYTSKDFDVKMPDKLKMPSHDTTYYAKWTAAKSKLNGPSSNKNNDKTSSTSNMIKNSTSNVSQNKNLPRTGETSSVLLIILGLVIVVLIYIFYKKRKFDK
ncbi:InlB B-repeat-containing protein, partial [Enterococcus gilvus]